VGRTHQLGIGNSYIRLGQLQLGNTRLNLHLHTTVPSSSFHIFFNSVLLALASALVIDEAVGQVKGLAPIRTSPTENGASRRNLPMTRSRRASGRFFYSDEGSPSASLISLDQGTERKDGRRRSTFAVVSARITRCTRVGDSVSTQRGGCAQM
jgi:hypothetical protein